MNARDKKKMETRLNMNPQVCPECLSKDIEASDYDSPEPKVLTCHVECNECGLEWSETYQFQGATILE